MELEPYVDEIHRPVTLAAAAAGAEGRALAERLIAPLAAAIRLAVQHALSDAADAITVEPAPRSVVFEPAVSSVESDASDRAGTVVDGRPTNPRRKSDVTAAEQTHVEYSDGRLRVMSPKGWRQWMPWGGRNSIDVHVDLPT